MSEKVVAPRVEGGTGYIQICSSLLFNKDISPHTHKGKYMSLSAPASGGAAITPHDTNEIIPTRALYIGVSGHVKVTTVEGIDLTFSNVPVGILPVRCKKVFSTGTTATNIVSMW